MEQYNRKSILLKLVGSIVLLAIATAGAITCVLLYKGTFNDLTFSNWLFYASMAYIALGGLSAYGTYMNTNNYNYKYMSTVMTGSFENRKRIDDELIKTGFRFMIRMICVGILLFVIAAAANSFK